MIRLGEIQTLKIIKKVEFGVYLAENGQKAENRTGRRRKFCFRRGRYPVKRDLAMK